MFNSKFVDVVARLTNAQVAALNTTPVVIGSLTAASTLVWVPRRIVINKPAGTAWTCASPARMEVYDDDGCVWFSTRCDGFFDQTTFQGRTQSADLQAESLGNATLSVRCVGGLTGGTGGLNIVVELEQVSLVF
jgi:hypothetical protein